MNEPSPKWTADQAAARDAILETTFRLMENGVSEEDIDLVLADLAARKGATP
jgi:hypothetical protein